MTLPNPEIEPIKQPESLDKTKEIVENKPEQQIEKQPETQIETQDNLAQQELIEAEIQQQSSSGSNSVVSPKSEQRIEIEHILAEGLEDFYKTMPENRKKEFKVKGEETAGRIEKLLMKSKVKVKKIVSLIKSWLKMIPGVNKYFLEQESKIKADKIIESKKQ